MEVNDKSKRAEPATPEELFQHALILAGLTANAMEREAYMHNEIARALEAIKDNHKVSVRELNKQGELLERKISAAAYKIELVKGMYAPEAVNGAISEARQTVANFNKDFESELQKVGKMYAKTLAVVGAVLLLIIGLIVFVYSPARELDRLDFTVQKLIVVVDKLYGQLSSRQ